MMKRKNKIKVVTILACQHSSKRKLKPTYFFCELKIFTGNNKNKIHDRIIKRTKLNDFF